MYFAFILNEFGPELNRVYTMEILLVRKAWKNQFKVFLNTTCQLLLAEMATSQLKIS